MATVTLLFKANKANDKGKMPLYIRIIHGRKTIFISLGKRVPPPEMWDEKKNRVKSKHPNSSRLNAYIARKLSEAQNTVLAIETN